MAKGVSLTEANRLLAEQGSGGRLSLAEATEILARKDAGTPISGPMEALMSGLSLGWSDELAGLAGGIADFTKGRGFKAGYERGKAAAKRNLENFSEDNPATSTALQVLGGLAGAAPARAFAAAPTLLGRVRQGVQLGVPIGAVAGAGGAEGDATDVALGAAQGATLGAGIGAALPAATQGISAAARHAGNMIGSRPAARVADEKLAAAMARDNTTPEHLLAELQRREAMGAKPEMLMDLGGEAMRRMTRTALSRPGEASSRGVVALTERQAGQPERVAQDLRRLSGNDDFYGTMEWLAQQRAKQARPLYQEAFNDPAPVWNERIQQFIESPEAQQGLRRGLTIQRRDALASGERFDPMSYGVTGFNAAGDPIIGGTPNLRLLDAIKRGMDDMLEAYRSPTTGRLQLDEAGRSLERVRRAFVREVDAAAPEVYRRARAAWAGPSQARDAMESGREFFRLDPEQIARRIAGMPAGEREFFRAGAARAIMDKLASTPDNHDVVRRIFGTPRMRAQVEAIFPTRQGFQEFERAMNREAAMLRNARFVSPNTNSQTFLRQADAADAAPNPVMEALAGVVQGESPRRALLGAMAGRAVSRVGGYTPEVSNRLGDAMLSTDPAVQRRVLTGLLGFRPHSPTASRIGGRARIGLLTTGGGLYGGRE